MLSEGKFDISIAPLVNLWKAALRGENMPSPAQQENVRSCVGYEKIELTPPDRISFRSSCLQLDLGAIGKGYAVDRAADVLHSLGIRDALINAGGSTIFAMGSPPSQTGLACTLERSLEQARSAGHAQGWKCVHVGANRA